MMSMFLIIRRRKQNCLPSLLVIVAVLSSRIRIYTKFSAIMNPCLRLWFFLKVETNFACSLFQLKGPMTAS
uniref:Uncharacterized protein n=1 Tax=Arundo donax TaxID=35708 RepID=A0A0A9H095_ARUDO